MSTTSKEFFTFSKGEGPAVTDQLGEKHRTYDAVALDAEEGNYYGFIEKVLPGNQFQVAWFYEPAEVELTAKDRKACLKNELFLSNHVDSNEGGTIAFRPTIYVCSNKKMVEEATKARNRLRPADRERAFIARRVFDHTKYQLGSVNLRQWNLHKHFQYMVERTKELLVPVNQLRYLMSWLIPLADVPGKAVVPDIEHGLGVIYNMGITFEDLVTTDVYKTCVKLFKHHPEPTVRSMARRTRAKLREVEDSYRLNHTKDALRRLQGRKRPRTRCAACHRPARTR